MQNKQRSLLFLILLLLILMGNSQAEKDGIKLVNYPTHSPFKSRLQLTSIDELNHIIVLPNSSFNEAEAAKIIANIDRLPNSLLSKVRKNGIIVKLFTNKLTDNPTAAHLSGKVPRGYEKDTTWDDIPGVGGGHTVLVKIGSSEKGSGHGSVNLELHELAHSIDRQVFDEIRKQKDFLMIWNLEKDRLFPYNRYLLTYPEEYFAEAFVYYYINDSYREKLRKDAPLTYDFIKNLK
ncbi:toxin [Niallia sp. XMNu-256]|uniref:anthrax toxin lethal factor-related metalloendopeptidase n=1 Tax=Niallia sp. XMNu-256 TaxID=3082444 RepID=UPI0030D25147